MWIPALYLAFIVALFFGRSLSTQTKGVDAEFQKAVDGGGKAKVDRDLPGFQNANDEHETLAARLYMLHTVSFTLAGGIGVGLLLFIWATWLVTQRAISRWEILRDWASSAGMRQVRFFCANRFPATRNRPENRTPARAGSC